MTEFLASLHSMADVNQFVGAASRMHADIDVISGRYTVDGKSILGICSLNLEQPVQVRVYGDPSEGQAFMDAVSAMVVAAD